MQETRARAMRKLSAGLGRRPLRLLTLVQLSGDVVRFRQAHRPDSSMWRGLQRVELVRNRQGTRTANPLWPICYCIEQFLTLERWSDRRMSDHARSCSGMREAQLGMVESAAP